MRACGEVPETGRSALLRVAAEDVQLAVLFDGSRHAPAPFAPDEVVAAGGIAPRWLMDRLAVSGVAETDAAALLDPAPLDLRLNTTKAGGLSLPVGAEPTKRAKGGR